MELSWSLHKPSSIRFNPLHFLISLIHIHNLTLTLPAKSQYMCIRWWWSYFSNVLGLYLFVAHELTCEGGLWWVNVGMLFLSWTHVKAILYSHVVYTRVLQWYFSVEVVCLVGEVRQALVLGHDEIKMYVMWAESCRSTKQHTQIPVKSIRKSVQWWARVVRCGWAIQLPFSCNFAG